MSILAIRLYPDPVLRARSREVTRFDPEFDKLVADMIETMHAAPGVGLAAPQVGAESRVAVVDVSVGKDPEQLYVLVNPELVQTAGAETDVEGCLSLPGITDKVERPLRIRVRALDRQGQAFELEGLPLAVEGPHPDPQRTLHLVGDPGEGEAALDVGLSARGLHQLGVDEDVELLRVLAHGDVDDGDPGLGPDLGRGQAHSGRGMHGLDHVGD